MTHRDPDPIQTPKCLDCGSTEHVRPTDNYEHSVTGKPWVADCCNRYFAGTATEALTHAARKIADAAARGDVAAVAEARRANGDQP